MILDKLTFENDIEQCLSALQSGGIILYPTDTIWGIGCDATNEESVEKIISLKHRPDNKSFVVLVSEERDVLKYVASLDLAVFDYLKQVNKPTTVIYSDAIGLANNITSKDGSVAIRICKDPFCRHLIKRFRKPIVSTSANISGQVSPQDFSYIDNAIVNGVDYTVQHRRDDDNKAVPSSIIKWQNGNVIVIRE